jgi:hypothetical protein
MVAGVGHDRGHTARGKAVAFSQQMPPERPVTVATLVGAVPFMTGFL